MPAQPALDSARERLIRVTSRFMLVLWLPLTLVQTALAYRAGESHAPAMWWVVAILVLSTAVLWRPLPGRITSQATVFVVLLYAGVALSFVLRGLHVRSTMGATLLVVWATLFFDRRGLWATLLALVPPMAVSAYRTGWQGLALRAIDDAGPGGAVRTALFVLAGLVLCALAVRAAVDVYTVALDQERRAIIAQQEDRLARAAAEQASEVLQRRQVSAAMTMGLAHDLNNAIHVTAMAASQLHEHESAAVRDIAAQIEFAVERAGRMVRGLQSYGRAVGNEAAGFLASEAVAGLRIILRGYIPKQVSATLSCETTARLAGDELRFGQVVMNLVINAVEAMPSGGDLTLVIEDADATHCAVRVHDTGAGIPVELREQIFEPYFTTKPPRDGGGLGLSMVSRLVSNVGGSISVASAVGTGTTFTVLWPREHAPS